MFTSIFISGSQEFVKKNKKKGTPRIFWRGFCQGKKMARLEYFGAGLQEKKSL